MIKVLSHSSTSRGARIIASYFNTRLIVPDPARSRFRANENHIIINWGWARPLPSHCQNAGTVINRPEAVANSVSKLHCLSILEQDDIPVPPYTNDESVAHSWWESGIDVVIRTLGRGSAGRGIVFADDDFAWSRGDYSNAALFTKYIPKIAEYRVHVIGDRTSVRQKFGRRGAEKNWRIRTHDNGFVYSRNISNLVDSDRVEYVGFKAVRALGLDFGAVDIVYNRRTDSLYVLEVNTAPGLMGSTVDEYTTHLEEYIMENLIS